MKSIMSSKISVVMDFDSYIKAGIIIFSQYTDKIKGYAFNLVNEYGKTKAHYLTKDEIVKLLQDKIDSENTWKIGSFME